MKNVEDAVKQLTSAIKESDIYQEYEKQLNRVKAVPELKAQIDEFRMRNFKLQTGGTMHLTNWNSLRTSMRNSVKILW